MCDNQDEIDYYWDRLTAGGDPKAQQCGWLKDKFGLSWQVVPSHMPDLSSPSGQRAMGAFLKMKKIDLAELERAAKG
jgi:predicted 3-demethylubiquinone-9 3-methyltransferase (glyoxalase superfamily)